MAERWATFAMCYSFTVAPEIINKTATTDPSGRFHFDHVPPGDYRVFAWAEVESDSWFDPEFMRNYEMLGARVRVAEDSTENVEVIAID
jgi:hypothetical protein